MEHVNNMLKELYKIVLNIEFENPFEDYEKNKRKAILIINPNSGDGKTWKRFNNSVKPILEKSYLTYDIFGIFIIYN